MKNWSYDSVLVDTRHEETYYGKVEAELVTRLERYFKQVDFDNAVIGISGGIDSAVVASLLVKALGIDHVTGVYLPYEVNGAGRDSVREGREVVDWLGIKARMFDIKYASDAVVRDMEDFQGPLTNNITKLDEGNLMARMRMAYLYFVSSMMNALVVGTTNRTEYCLGYYTIHGDGACAVEPIIDLLKKDVYGLAKHQCAPIETQTRPPSDGLWEGHTDEDDLGPYAEVDMIVQQFLGNFSYPGWDPGVSGIWREAGDRKDTTFERARKNRFKMEGPAHIPCKLVQERWGTDTNPDDHTPEAWAAGTEGIK